MKPIFQLTSIAAVLLLLLSSCSPRLTPFTERLRVEADLSGTELQRVQFFLSDDVVFGREITESNTAIKNGEIKLVNGKEVEQIRIKKGTPGVMVLNPKKKRIGVSFEKDSDTHYLMFGPNPKNGNRYTLLASAWKNGRGKVTYNGETYYTQRGASFAHLMVDLKKYGKTKVKSKTASGRKLD